MKYTVKPSGKFKKDLRQAEKRGCDIAKITEAIKILANGEALPPEYKDHLLSGNYAGKRECHIGPDWLLVYEIYKSDLILYLVRTGSHSDLFS